MRRWTLLAQDRWHSARPARPPSVGKVGDHDERATVPRTKIATPRVPASFVPRTDLRDLLDAATRKPVTVVRASAGYGKTQLLADWVEATGGADKAWLTLDRGDNDPYQLWSGLLHAICACKVVPPDSRLHELTPPRGSDMAGFLTEVVDALDVLPGPLYVVLDDVHELVRPEPLRGLATVIRHQPADLRFILASRGDVLLPLARLRLQGQLAEIPAGRLKFSVAQADDLLAAAGVHLDRGRLRVLVQRTDGWAAALRLAARSLRQGGDTDTILDRFADDDRSMADYLDSQLLSGLDAGTREFLAEISVCDEVSPALAGALTGQADAGVLLDALTWEGPLLIAAGSAPPWYRMHPLVRAYLRAELERQQPDRVAALHRAAAAWFAAEGQLHMAFGHAAQIDEATVLTLLRGHAVRLLLQGDYHVVRRGLAMVGTEGDPWLGSVAALADLQVGALADAEARLRQSAPMDAQTATLHQLVASTYAFLTGAPLPAQPLAPTEPELAAWAQSIRACGLVQSADRQSDCARVQARAQARAELAEAEALARRHGLHQLVLHCRTATAFVTALDLDLGAMEQACAEVIGLAGQHGWRRSPWVAMSHALRGIGALLRLEPADALRHATQASRMAGPDMPRSWRFLLGLVEGGARFDAGHRRDGLRLLRQARAQLSDETVPIELVALVALLEQRAAVALGADAVRELPAWVAGRGEAAAELALMGAWAAGGTLDPPREPLLGCLTQLEARLLEAAAAIRAGERTRARAALSTALRLAEPVRLIRPFERADPALRQLLVDQIGGFGESESFASQVHRALSAAEQGRGDGLLTGREHVVLVALTSQRSLEEIAADLRVSVNTVKTHVRAIYSKLGAGSRRTAVLAARELGLT